MIPRRPMAPPPPPPPIPVKDLLETGQLSEGERKIVEEALKKYEGAEDPPESVFRDLSQPANPDPIVEQFNKDDAAFAQLHRQIDDEIQESTRISDEESHIIAAERIVRDMPGRVRADAPTVNPFVPLQRESANHMTMERAIRNVLDAQEYLRATHGVYMTWEMRK